MGGVVEKVEAKAGQAVKAGDLLCVISAMKMEVSSTRRRLPSLTACPETDSAFSISSFLCAGQGHCPLRRCRLLRRRAQRR
jgi:hypothetical protein